MEQTYIPLREAAGRYGVTYDRLRRAAYDGRLLVVREDGRWLVRPTEIERFIRDGGKAPKIERQPRRQGTASARVIAVAIPKGGTGKTTTTLNLGVALAERGQRVLTIDCDPQGSLTSAVGLDTNRLDLTLQDTIERYMRHFTTELDRAIVETREGIDLVPTNALLNRSNTDLLHALEPQKILRKLIDPLRERYDFILLDTLPYLGVLVQNALAAADEVVIPLEAAALSSHSARVLIEQIDVMRRSGLNPTLRILGFLFTRVDPTVSVQREHMAYARRTFGEDATVFHTTIEDRSVIVESQTGPTRGSLFSYRPTDPATQAYRALANEVLYGTA